MAEARPGRNIGALDQTLRLGIGTALVMMWIFGPIGWWGILGFLPLVTGMTGVCPVYGLLGWSTWRPPPPSEAPAAAAPSEAAPPQG